MAGDPPAPVAVRIARLPGADDLPLPAYATAGSAGLDLPAAVDGEQVLAPGERALVPTGFRIELPPGFEAQVRPRSGLALRHGVVLPNAPGTIDSDYRGELRVILWNTEDLGYLTVYAGAALANDELKRGAKTFKAGSLGEFAIVGDNILLGQPFVFTKENIDRFDF